jgi:hypothetical protein
MASVMPLAIEKARKIGPAVHVDKPAGFLHKAVIDRSLNIGLAFAPQ